jgi:hypothetical protein
MLDMKVESEAGPPTSGTKLIDLIASCSIFRFLGDAEVLIRREKIGSSAPTTLPLHVTQTFLVVKFLYYSKI